MQTTAWLRKLQREDPEKYRQVFSEFKTNVPQGGGRSKKRQGFNPRQLISTKTTEAVKQSRCAGNYEDMRFGRYIKYFTQEVLDPEEMMTDAEARISWLKEEKRNIKVYSHKQKKFIDVEVVSVLVNLTRHQEQLAVEKDTATVVLQTQNNATQQQISAAASKALSFVSMGFNDDMFHVPGLNMDEIVFVFLSSAKRRSR